jgi:transporter family protein
MSLDNNAVIPVLFANTLISSLIFVPFILLSYTTNVLDETMFHVPHVSLKMHGLVMLKSVIVTSSWIAGYYSVKNLPLTITGPIKATQPVITLTGALLVFSERLNPYQWTGVFLAILSFYLLSTSGKKEGIRFSHNKWIFYAVLSIILGAVSGLYDKYLMGFSDVMTVQVWSNIYQLLIMIPILLLLWYPRRKTTTPYQWRWSISFVSLFLVMADWIYFYALGFPDAMVSIVSMIRRSSVLVTFMAGAIFFHEKNLKNKAFDLLLALLGMIFLYLGTR